MLYKVNQTSHEGIANEAKPLDLGIITIQGIDGNKKNLVAVTFSLSLCSRDKNSRDIAAFSFYLKGLVNKCLKIFVKDLKMKIIDNFHVDKVVF